MTARPSTPSLRRAGSDDAPTLSALADRLYVETFVEDYAIAYPLEDLQAFLIESNAAEQFAAKISDPRFGVWVLEEDGALIGYAVAGPCTIPHPDARPDYGELSRLYVARSAQGRGLGRLVLDAVMGWLERDGPRPLWLSVWSGNLGAQRLYAGLGFEVIGQYDFPVGRWMDVDLIMRRM